MFGRLLKSTASCIAFPARRTPPKKTVVFILSSAHSGSTWTGYVLGSGPKSAFVGEYHRAWKEAIRVPCTICAARGLPACEVLHDVEKEPARRAFDLAFARTGKRVIVDNSKDLDWIRAFRIGDTLDMRIVFVVKDPRGFLASVKRRGHPDLGAVIPHWSWENRRFCDFIAKSGIPSVAVSYDLAAKSPEHEFRRLYEFCGMRFTNDCLSYWNVEHHGFAANGASDAILRGKGFPHVPEHFRTGDVAFYGENSKTLFHDRRWRSDLTPAELAAIENNPEVRGLLKSLGFALTTDGIARETPSFAGQLSAGRSQAGAKKKHARKSGDRPSASLAPMRVAQRPLDLAQGHRAHTLIAMLSLFQGGLAP